MATNGPSSAAEPTAGTAANNNLSKDEVGWYFVEQYYTTLSKSPEKLHLFYGKRSQFVYGMEAEVANVAVGRQAIQERIEQLDFQDCKVRISNVDSQASFDNIVIQVIGETSSKAAGGEPKKFVQTFVLAQQPSGYFVLNDILRYVNEEGEDDAVAAPAAEEPVAAPETELSGETEVKDEVEPAVTEKTPQDTASGLLDPTVVDKKLEEVTTSAPEAITAEEEPEVAAAAPEEDAVEPEAAAPVALDPETTVRELEEEDAKEHEKPIDPSPTPVAPVRGGAPEPEKAAPVPAPVPAKPMTWASRAAAAAGPPRAAVPLPKTATPPAQAQTRAPAPAAAPAAAAPSAAAAPASTPAQAPAATPQQAETPAKDTSSGAAEWQTAGADSKKQNRPQSLSTPPAEGNGTLGYVKYVTEKVKTEDLRAALAKFGELTYFDINRQKNCAFVEFATTAGYQAAMASSPITVNGESIQVEPRRPKATAYGGSNYAPGRGNLAGRGRGGYEGGRGGSQGGSRGGFAGGQSRGRGMPRGRGASQATNA